MGDVEAGFAKLQGENFEYYMQTYSIVLGMNNKKSSVDIDLSYLGGGMNISHQHARIYYDFDRKRFALEVIGKNGCLVEGVLYLPGNTPIKSESQDLLQIGDKKFYFLLPVRKIVKPQHQHLNLNANANNASLALPTSAVPVPGGASGTLKKRGGRKEDDHYQQQEQQHPPTKKKKKWRSQTIPRELTAADDPCILVDGLCFIWTSIIICRYKIQDTRGSKESSRMKPVVKKLK